METPIQSLVQTLMESYQNTEGIIRIEARHQISKAAVIDIIDALQRLIFAGFFGKKPLKRYAVEYYVGDLVEYLLHNLRKQIGRALRYRNEDAEALSRKAESVTHIFLERLPAIRGLLATDVEAAYAGDPAAYCKDEIVLSYPGIYAIMVNRLAHELYTLDVPLIPRMMTEYAHSLTGIDIHPGATIGPYFFIDHGTGVVIGETTVIGEHVRIYQGVTLGAISTKGGQFLHGTKRHPTIEDHVTIYSGASILGGGTVIGANVVIGSNAFITKSVPEQTRVSVKNPELQFKEGRKTANVEFVQSEFWNYEI
jgi:serine O-acetyltransferase